jgi:hypothetical protein
MKQMILPVLATLLLFSCQKSEKGGTFRGAERTFHEGRTSTYIKIDREGKPEQLAITVNDALLASVKQSGGSGHTYENSVNVPLHPKALETTPFKFVMLDWMPDGHEPMGVYDSAHFDLHFYMTAQNEVANYLDAAKLAAKPAPSYIPAMHMDGPGIPKMGKHWNDITSPEFSGGGFTQTFIYGSYDSKVVFYEPMITHSFLKSTVDFARSIPQPDKVQVSGYYPTKMKIVKHDGVTDIILDGFTYRTGS